MITWRKITLLFLIKEIIPQLFDSLSVRPAYSTPRIKKLNPEVCLSTGTPGGFRCEVKIKKTV